MIIAVWFLFVICSSVIIGEIKYRYFDKKKIGRKNKSFSLEWTEDIDVDMGELSMEIGDNNFVPTRVLAMRGSWRLAQNQVMGEKTFGQLKSEEYRKKL